MIGNFPVISHLQAKEMLDNLEKNKRSFYTSLDLGRSRDKVEVVNEYIILPDKSKLSIKQLKKILKDKRKCYVILEERAYPIVIFSETTGWVRTLQPTAKAPTSNVGGFIMHRIKDIDPLEDAKRKIKALKLKSSSVVLDTCLGLGYTAIEAAKKAKIVYSIEIDEAALKIAKLNPWSKELFEFSNIEIKIGDVSEVIKTFPNNFFTHIIHDPPNIRLAGELYSLFFYKNLFKKLKFKGKLLHYVGNPQKKQGRSVFTGVLNRLKQVGFKKVKKEEKLFAVLAYKT